MRICVLFGKLDLEGVNLRIAMVKIFSPNEGALHHKGYVLDPDTLEELSIFSNSEIGQGNTLVYPSNFAEELAHSFEVTVDSAGAGLGGIGGVAEDTIEGVSTFSHHSSSRQYQNANQINLMEQEKWWILFRSLVHIASFGSFLEIVMATRKAFNFMRLQGMCAFDKEKPYESEFFVNTPIAWYGHQEYRISLSRIMMRISHLLILRLLYPKLRDVLVICRHFTGKILLLATPASSWLDAVSEDRKEVDDVSAAHFCIGQQTLHIVRILGAGLLHTHSIVKARLVSLLTSNKFVGPTGPIVDLPRSKKNHLNRYVAIQKLAYIEGLRKLLGEHLPGDFPETTRRLWADRAVSELVDRTDFSDMNALRQVSAYMWNNLLFVGGRKRKREIASLGDAGLSSQFLELLDQLTRSNVGGGSSDSDGEDVEEKEGNDLRNQLQSGGTPAFLHRKTSPVSEDSVRRRRPRLGAERTFSSARLSQYLRGCIEQLKHTKIDAVKAKEANTAPYPRAGMDLVLERYCVHRQQEHIICRSDTWRHKQCAYCSDVNAPVPKTLSATADEMDMETWAEPSPSEPLSLSLPVLVCESCCRPFHQQCLHSADRNPRVLLGDIHYKFICRDCSVYSRHATWPQSQTCGVTGEDLFREVVKRSERTLLDAAVVALSILTVRHKYKYGLFDLRAVWSVISHEWQHMQPMVMYVTTSEKFTTFVNEPTDTVPLSKNVAQGKLIVMLRDHPAFAVRDTVLKNDTSDEQSGTLPVPLVGFSSRFRSVALSVLPLQ